MHLDVSIWDDSRPDYREPIFANAARDRLVVKRSRCEN
jgi:hypothetical protein